MSEIDVPHTDGLPQDRIWKPSWRLIVLFAVVAGALLLVAIFGLTRTNEAEEQVTVETLPPIQSKVPVVVESSLEAEFADSEQLDIVPADEYEITVEAQVPEIQSEFEIAETFDALVDDEYQNRLDKLLDALHVSPEVEVDLAVYPDPEEEPVESASSQPESSFTHVLKTGSIIPAVLIAGINSDIPGVALAQVSKNVYDSTSGTNLLIPQGSRLTGTYDTGVQYRQSRVMVRWNQVLLPSGHVVDLGDMVGSDESGFAGFEDEVDNHLWQMFGASALTSIIAGTSTYAARGDESETDSNFGLTATSELGRQWGQTGQELVKRHLDVRPTIRINSGFKFTIVVTQRLEIPSYDSPI